MNRERLIEIIKGFARDGKVFSNEQDFQFELAVALKSEPDVAEVKLEAVSFPKEIGNLREKCREGRSKYLDVDGSKKEYTDIIVKTHDGKYYAIELKFKAEEKAYLYVSKAFGDVAVLKHGAIFINSYLFLNDIVRLENINRRMFSSDQIRIENSFAILLTNHKNYRESDFSGSKIWNDFPINEKREILHNETLSVCDEKGKYERFAPLTFKGSYCFLWDDYPLEQQALFKGAPKFSFLVVEVPPQEIGD